MSFRPGLVARSIKTLLKRNEQEPKKHSIDAFQAPAVAFQMVKRYDECGIPTARTMPKCPPDLALQRRAKEFVQRHNGNHAAAAAALGFDDGASRTKLWRFVQTGRALKDTRQDFAERMDQCDERRAAPQNATKPRPVAVEAEHEISLEEARQIRDLCRRVMAMVDFFEASLEPAGTANANRSAAASA